MNRPLVTAMNAMPSNTDPQLSRRDFLSLTWKSLLAISGFLSLAGLLRFLGYRSDPAPQTVFDLGPAENYASGSSTLIPEAQAMLLHPGNSFYALSLVCPHLGCQIEAVGDGFTCPCHGSQFSRDGRLVSGPAQNPLRQLRVEQNEQGNLILYTQ